MDVQYPLTVSKNQEFDITVTVKNNATKTQTLNSIEISDEYLEGIEITTSDSINEGSYYFLTGQYYEYYYDIPPGEEEIITFRTKTIKAGDFFWKYMG